MQTYLIFKYPIIFHIKFDLISNRQGYKTWHTILYKFEPIHFTLIGCLDKMN